MLRAVLPLRCAERVKDFVARLLVGGPSPGEVLLWYDWMQSMSLHQARIETNSMFYGPQKKASSAFGRFTAQCHSNGHVTHKSLTIITDVLAVTVELCNEATKHRRLFLLMAVKHQICFGVRLGGKTSIASSRTKAALLPEKALHPAIVQRSL